MKKGLKDILFFGIIFTIIDQVVKIVLSSKIIVNQTYVVIKDFFSITLVHNKGAAFSILTGSKILLILIGIVALVGLIIYIKKLEVIDDIDIFTYSLLMGGIVGNLIDRIVYGYVIDYLSFKFGSYYFPIFNFADICIVVSVIIMLLRMIKEDLWR
ncbi:MAG: signal peptidase II [Firmicutes bacterium]|nr:signal peptidase II [Bacillota bacterium]